MKFIGAAVLVAAALVAFGWAIICSADPEGRGDPKEIIGALGAAVGCILGAVAVLVHF